MDVREAIDRRHSVRQYADKPVARETIERLLQAAVHAPSAMNTQSWSFGVIQGREQVQAYGERARQALLREFAEQESGEGMRERLASPDFHLFYNAPALVVIYATTHDPYATINCTLAAENLMLAACAEGLGSCWIGSAGPLMNSPEAKQELGVPDDDAAIAILILGYPAEPTVTATTKNPPKILYWK